MFHYIKFTYITGLFLLLSNYSWAEGTRELEPNAANFAKLSVGGSNSTGAYAGDSLFGMYISIEDPANEIIYYGFGQPFSGNNPFNNFTQGRYRIKDPQGNVVFGPLDIPTSGLGHIRNHGEAFAGPRSLVGPAGYADFSFKPTQQGDYRIEFVQTTDPFESFKLRYFDFTVANQNTQQAIPGRLFTFKWNLNSSNFQVASYSKFFVYTPDSVVTRLDLNGMQAFGFNVFCNNSGPKNVPNDIIWNRKSYPSTAINLQRPQYKLFLNDPDSTIYPSRSLEAAITSPVQINGCPSLGYCIEINVNRTGQSEIYIERNGSPGYQVNTTDRKIDVNLSEGFNCVRWDGKDGRGTPVPDGDTIAIQVGVIAGLTHFPINDAERNVNGLRIDVIRPGNRQPRVFWDDRLVGGTLNLTGCQGSCHQWTSIGNNAVMNTWWFIDRDDTLITYTVRNQCPLEAYNDYDTIVESGSVTLKPLDNDFDDNKDIDSSSFQVISGPKNGTVSRNGFEFTYTPNPNFFCNDTIAYQISDNGPTLPFISDSVYTDTAYMVISVLPDTPSVTVKQLRFCQFDSTHFAVARPSSSDYTVAWFAKPLDETPIHLGDTFPIPSAKAGNFSYYAAQQRKGFSCYGLKTLLEAEVIGLKSLAFQALSPRYCSAAGQSLNLNPQDTGGRWLLRVLEGNAAPSINGNILSLDQAGLFRLGYTHADGQCNFDTGYQTFRILPRLDIGKDTSICSGESLPIGTRDTIPGAVYRWVGNTIGISDTTIPNPSLNLSVFTPSPRTVQYVLRSTYTDSLGSCQDFDTMNVTVSPLPTYLPQVSGPRTFCPGIRGQVYTALGQLPTGMVYEWQVSGGTIAQDLGDSIVVDWGNPGGNGLVSLRALNTSSGCAGGFTDYVTRPGNYVPNVELVRGVNDSICKTLANAVEYTLKNPVPNVKPLWTLTEGTILGAKDSTTVRIDWGDANTATLSVSLDFSTPFAFCGGTSSYTIDLLQAPDQLKSIFGKTEICSGDTAWYHTNTTLQPENLNWSVQNGNILQNRNDSILVAWATTGQPLLEVTELNDYGLLICEGAKASISPTIMDVAQPNLQPHEQVLCAGKLQGASYRYDLVDPDNKLNFEWKIIGGRLLSPSDTNFALVEWASGASTFQLEVVASSTAGCSNSQLFSFREDLSSQDFLNVSLGENQESIVLDYSLSGGPADSLNLNMPVVQVKRGNTWETLTRLDPNTSQYQYTDTMAQAQPLEYRILHANYCGDTLRSTQHRTVFLEGQNQNEQSSVLLWNAFATWPEGLREYEVYRNVDSAGYELYQTANTNGARFENAMDGFRQCYRIKAISNDGKVSWSNESCINFENKLEIYNVVTPNGDGKNDHFTIMPLDLYGPIQVKLYNRWGSEVFKSENYRNNYDGGKLPTGTYFYLVTVPQTGHTQKGFVEFTQKHE